MDHARGRLVNACALAVLALLIATPARASDPSSHDVAVPTRPGETVTVEWTGIVPPGAQAAVAEDCTNAPLFDDHTIDLTVPAGTYRNVVVHASGSIQGIAADLILSVTGPQGFSASSDNGFVSGTESVALSNPVAGTYTFRVCAFAGVADSYTGRLEITASAIGECPPDTLEGIDLQRATILDLQRAMERGTLTSRELVDAYLRRIQLYDKKTNAIRALNPRAREDAGALDAERAAKGARGPLHGIPILLKDNVNTTDMPTTAGSIALEGSVPLHEATLVTKLKQAGAVILGKLNLSEFAGWVSLLNPPGYSSLGGQVRNAYHFGDPSGSSSGSGVAASMAYAAATIGTETSGSILSPSWANSAVGIKTTVGLVSRAGVLPLSPTFDTPGPITRNVTDAAIVLGAITGVDPRDSATPASEGKLRSDYRAFLRSDALRGARIGISDVDRPSGAEGDLFDAAIAKLEALGATIVHDDRLGLARDVGLVEIGAIPNEFKASLNEYLATETPETLRVRTLADIERYNNEHADKFPDGQNLITASNLTLGNMEGPDAIALRTAAITGARTLIDAVFEDEDLDAFLTPKAVNANLGAAAQYPSIGVQAGYRGKDQPFGISLLGKPFTEDKLIGFAYAFEQRTHLRVRPTAVNPGLCPPRVRRAVLGARHTSRPGNGSLPATGVEDGPALLLASSLALGARMRRARAR